MKKGKVFLRSIALLMALTLCVALVGCGGGGKETIKFAVVGSMTGDNAVMGQHQVAAVKLAVEEINAAGGINGKKLEYQVFDDQGMPNQAILVAQKITTQGDLQFVVGPIHTSCAMAAMPTYEAAKLPVVSPTNTVPPITQQGYKYYARVITRNDISIGTLVDFAITERGFKRPAVVWENTDLGKGDYAVVQERFAKLGVEEIDNASFNPSTDKDFTAIITRFKSENPDCIIFCSEYTPASIFLNQKADLGLTVPLIASAACVDPKLIELAGENANGSFMQCTFDPLNTSISDKVAPFVENYKAKNNGTTPGEWAAFSYDDVYFIAEALKTNPKDGTALMEALHNVTYTGVTGPTKLNEFGDIDPPKPVSFVQVVNGEFKSLPVTKINVSQK